MKTDAPQLKLMSALDREIFIWCPYSYYLLIRLDKTSQS